MKCNLDLWQPGAVLEGRERKNRERVETGVAEDSSGADYETF